MIVEVRSSVTVFPTDFSKSIAELVGCGKLTCRMVGSRTEVGKGSVSRLF